jgi:hypothetical protein
MAWNFEKYFVVDPLPVQAARGRFGNGFFLGPALDGGVTAYPCDGFV